MQIYIESLKRLEKSRIVLEEWGKAENSTGDCGVKNDVKTPWKMGFWMKIAWEKKVYDGVSQPVKRFKPFLRGCNL